MTGTKKVVVISGGMGGVGRAAAKAFAREKSGAALMAPEDVARTIVRLCTDAGIPSGRSYLVSSGADTPL